MSDNFKKALKDVSTALDNAMANKSDFELESRGALLDFRGVQQEHYKRAFYQSVDALEKNSLKLKELTVFDEHNERVYQQIVDLLAQLRGVKSGLSLRGIIDKIDYYFSQFNTPKTNIVSINSAFLPQEIKSELLADVEELNKCFNANCFRSAVILCGRILETSLHSKYFQLTGNDLLETSPGLGLGNVVAKINEKGIKLDPGLTNQIHLINQIRVHSVHKKSDAFIPSRTQTHAILLYTLDVVEKLFRVHA